LYFGIGGYWGWPYYGYYPYGYGYGYGAGYGSYYADPYAYDSSYYNTPYYGGQYSTTPYDNTYANQYSYPQAPAQAQQAPVAPQTYAQQRPPAPAPASTQPGGSPDYYLIAFSDHSIRAAISYTVDGDTIHWTTREHEQMQAPLSSVDRRFSEQINRDRHVEFRLP